MPHSGFRSTSPIRFFTRTIGYSAENRPLLLHQTAAFDAAPGGTLLIGGMHGDERATTLLLLSFQDRLRRGARAGSAAPPLGIIALANPDGFVRNTRLNARNVDLNRNFATAWSAASDEPPGPAPWSEPESRALRDFILYQRPQRMVTLHWALGELDADGEHSNPLAQTMWDALTETERAPYRLRLAGSNSVCPGSLGQWCGEGLRYPDGSATAIVTLELPHDPAAPRSEPLPEAHLATLRRAWKRDAHAYLRAVQPPVHKMLAAACQCAELL
ncbi:MAG: M14 family zinc carboxypeptidase [Verrucomicrobiota bacterium]